LWSRDAQGYQIGQGVYQGVYRSAMVTGARLASRQ
jgi:hypothetical protein